MKKNFYIFGLFILIFNNCSNAHQLDDKKEIKAKEIIEKIKNKEDINLENIHIKDDLDFTKIFDEIQENKNHFRSHIYSAIIFSNCTFEDKVLAFSKEKRSQFKHYVTFHKNIIFINCKFKDEVNFKESKMKELSNFSNSIFLKKTSFEGVNFEKVYFVNVSFEDKVKFQRSIFHKSADFLKSKFEKKVSFQSVIFKNNAQFGGNNFYNFLDFSNVIVDGHLFFNQSKFEKEILFNDCIFDKRAEFVGSEFLKKVDFNNSIFRGKTLFNNAIFNDELDFSEVFFVLGFPQIENLSINKENILLKNACFLTKKEILKEQF